MKILNEDKAKKKFVIINDVAKEIKDSTGIDYKNWAYTAYEFDNGYELVDSRSFGIVWKPVDGNYEDGFYLNDFDSVKEFVNEIVLSIDAKQSMNRSKVSKSTKNILDESLFENLQGEYSDKFSDLVRFYSENLNLDALRSLCLDIIRYSKEEDLKDLWFDREYSKIVDDSDVDQDLFELEEDVNLVSTTEVIPPLEGPEVGVFTLVNEAIKRMYDDIQTFTDIGSASHQEGINDLQDRIADLVSTSNNQIETLKSIQASLSPVDQTEVTEVSPNVIVTEDFKEENSQLTGKADEIYKSFKNIEKELNYDGEAVTAVVNKMYQDNKDDSEYKKAYDKWSSGE